ncbi:DUF2461 domain-containing protein [Robiginitalea sp. IMCC43444]|uniref:DUF2461 domain-containing protein n=1 Tax=Robiginitalea sp. IMCC43444 TaxID=3459121 RepID=UPI00404388BE
MNSPVISEEALEFLKKLKENNNRQWFEARKKEFKKHQNAVKEFYTALSDRLREHDEIDKVKLFRIYRDVRFSADKTPYKPHFAGSFSRMGEALRGGYYLRIRPGESFIAGGFWQPNKEDLLRIRKELEMDAASFRHCIGQKGFREIWGQLQGEEVKTAPKGFDRNHPDIDLIRKKAFIFTREFSDKEVLAPDFMVQVNESFKAIRPYFDLMSEILTTDLNGESLLS